jgi:dGTP triphosphohydrolase
MTNNVYTNPICKSEEGKAMEMVKCLFNYFCEKPDRLLMNTRKFTLFQVLKGPPAIILPG